MAKKLKKIKKNSVSSSNSTTNQEQEYKEKYLRILSEFTNYQKNNMKVVESEVIKGKKRIIYGILEFLDDYSLFINNNQFSEEIKNLLYSMQSKLQNILSLEGIIEIDIKVGDAYDSSKAEVIQGIDGNPELKDKVVSVLQKGYLLNESVLRLAKVIVGR